MIVHGIALPDSERHFVGTLEKLHSEGSSFEYPALLKALNFLNYDRRRVALDIGAHVGLWSRWLVNHFEFVHAYEPVEEYAALYAANVGPSRQLHKVALGDGYASVGMKTYPENTGQAHICGKGETVQVSLDSYRLKRVDLVKIDVEGYELQVVKGARETLLENRPIVIIEQRGCDEVNFGRPRDEALAYLLELGMVEKDREHYDYIMGWA